MPFKSRSQRANNIIFIFRSVGNEYIEFFVIIVAWKIGVWLISMYQAWD